MEKYVHPYNIFYPGSSLQIAFGESEENTNYFLLVDNKKYILEEALYAEST